VGVDRTLGVKPAGQGVGEIVGVADAVGEKVGVGVEVSVGLPKVGVKTSVAVAYRVASAATTPSSGDAGAGWHPKRNPKKRRQPHALAFAAIGCILSGTA
jgi:hypothetical protein